MDKKTISASLQPCLRLFNDFVVRNDLAAHVEVSNASWHEQLGRLRIWSANIGAHQTGHSSLDYRLRDASHIRERILSLLSNLKRALEETVELLQDDEQSDEDLLDLEPGQELETEVQQLFRVIANKIKCLFQMSMLIRKPANRDRLLRARAEEAAMFEPLYRNHIREKYPGANPAVVENLAMGTARRKAELMYHERHHIKLGQGLDEDSEAVSETVASDLKDTNIDFDDLASTSAFTQTSYAPSLEGGNGAISVPPPPKACEYGEPFECPYCFFIITVRDRRGWTRHVFKDLMPYSCVFEGCADSKKMFDSRHEWFNHELKCHLRAGLAVDALVDALCPLCHEEMRIGRLERHLARHLEELSLFVIDRNSDELEDSDQSHAAREKIGNLAGEDSSDSDDEKQLGDPILDEAPSHVTSDPPEPLGPPRTLESLLSYETHSNRGDPESELAPRLPYVEEISSIDLLDRILEDQPQLEENPNSAARDSALVEHKIRQLHPAEQGSDQSEEASGSEFQGMWPMNIFSSRKPSPDFRIDQPHRNSLSPSADFRIDPPPRTSQSPSPDYKIDHATRVASESLGVLDEEDAEEVVRTRYEARKELWDDKEKLAKAEKEETEIETAMRAIEDWKRKGL